MIRTLMSATLLAATAIALSPAAAFASEFGLGSADKAPLTMSKRSKPRIPGGSGCDDPEDLIEHPECRGYMTDEAPLTISKRSKPRVPGGSGCDDPEDLIEHPECRG